MTLNLDSELQSTAASWRKGGALGRCRVQLHARAGRAGACAAQGLATPWPQRRPATRLRSTVSGGRIEREATGGGERGNGAAMGLLVLTEGGAGACAAHWTTAPGRGDYRRLHLLSMADLNRGNRTGRRRGREATRRIELTEGMARATATRVLASRGDEGAGTGEDDAAAAEEERVVAVEFRGCRRFRGRGGCRRRRGGSL